MKIVITGALGQIGSGLIRTLPFSFPESEIVMIDNLQSRRCHSLAGLPREGNYRFIEADILSADIDSIFEKAGAVIHLAAITHPLPVYSLETMEQVNVQGTGRVAKACVNAGAPLIFISTTSVYGKTAGIAEEENPKDLNPQGPYAQSKLRAEGLIRDLANQGKLRSAILRFATVFGVSPGMQFQTAIHKFCWQALTGQPLTVWKTALRQQRPYLELKDAVRAIEFILRRKLFSGEIFNAATAHSTVEEILQILRERIPALAVDFTGSGLMNEWSYEVSCKRLTSCGFEFQGNLRNGIREIVAALTQAFAGFSKDKISVQDGNPAHQNHPFFLAGFFPDSTG